MVQLWKIERVVGFLKMKFVSSLVLAGAMFLGATTSSQAATNYNVSEDKELWTVNYNAGTVIVPFFVTGTIKMSINVNWPGKIIAKESLYATIPNGNTYPFVVSLTSNTIKYYKNGAYLSTHALNTPVTHYKDPDDVTSSRTNSPYSDFADTSTHKAIGYGVFMSTKVFPASRSFDTTEEVIK